MTPKTNVIDQYNSAVGFQTVAEDNVGILSMLGLSLTDLVCLAGDALRRNVAKPFEQ